jgi:hypothetical protein
VALSRIADDMRELSAVGGRFAGTEGERAMLAAIRPRLPEGWSVRTEGFVGHVRPDFIVAGHVVLLVLVGLAGAWFPGWAVLPAALITASLLGEATGRFALLRRLLVKAASYNLVARDHQHQPLGSVVLTANLDLPRSRRGPRSGLRLVDRAWQAMFWMAMVVTLALFVRSTGDPFGAASLQVYLFTLGLLVGTALIRLVRRPAREGRDEAGGPAVLIELMRRFADDPVPGVEVWVAFTGCGSAYQGGMCHFLDLHRPSLRDPVMVVAIEAPERAPLAAVVSEGPVFAQEHRATGPALVERLGWAGVDLPEIRLFGATDARAAQLQGVRSLALAGGDGPSSVGQAERAADLIEVLVRWYAEDVAQVAGDRPRLEALGKALEDMRKSARRGRRRRGREAPPASEAS